MYYFKEIKTTDLDEARKRSQRTVYHTVDGSSKFQVLVVDPGSNSIKEAKMFGRLRVVKQLSGV